jgi:hypothetical protein
MCKGIIREIGIAHSVQRTSVGWISMVRFPVGNKKPLFFAPSVPVLGPRQPSIQRVPRALSRI